MLFISNARVVINTIFAGIFDRLPDLQMVSVESGIGWIPFILETIDYEMSRTRPSSDGRAEEVAVGVLPGATGTRRSGSSSNQGDVQDLIDTVGEDRILFETDFPHPTCLYPNPLETVAEKMATLRPETRRKVMGENAARLYRV